jgi:hypothetical protein
VVDGVPYCTNVVMPTAAADTDLGTPIGTSFAQALTAVVELSVSGSPGTNSTYIICQGDWGDGNFVDLSWALSTITSGSDNFVLSAGTAGANAVRQTRTPGTPPGSSGSVQLPLPGRIRFVGRSQLTGGSSPQVKATVLVKLLGLR